ncbi:39S ribosomal protein L51, mitochondrial [Lingula anatina]|uniref:Large ribosomal subunit protein mL51 n=1 Tax=Lingula anatina TaxID=7574 RepID=A0A1S3JNT3_LINAN|nr:39S ribosomal protein L51, mitochondrial [Lingula anatina]|eukprot:XP_013412012.1 39S ribosomal protein L51, mitochondrial [Lingula anatina]
MSWLTAAVRQASRLVPFSGTASNTKYILGRFTAPCVTCVQHKSDTPTDRTSSQWTAADRSTDLYEPPSPYKLPHPIRYGYNKKIFDRGLLPRLKNDENPLPIPKKRPKDLWEPKRALFGQNDYIDILGDGSVHPTDTLRGPWWLRGWRGNEMRRIIRRLNLTGAKLRYYRPTKYKQLKKRLKFLYKRHNVGRRRGGGLH